MLLDGIGISDRLAGVRPNMPMTRADTNRILAFWTPCDLRQQRIVACERVIAIRKGPGRGVVTGLIFTDDTDGHA